MDLYELLKEHLEEAREKDYHLDAVAASFCAKMELEHPAEFTAWLHERAPIFVRREMGRLEHAKRTTARVRAKARAFGEAIDGGDVQDYFLSTAYIVDEQNTRRRMGDMTGADHRFVASQYEVTGKEALMMAAFHKALAKKIGSRKTSEVYTEEQIAALWGRYIKPAA